MGRQAGFWLVSGFVLASGCAQIAGIDETSGAAPPDPNRASLTLTHRSIGATQVVGPQDLSGLDATFLVPNAAAADGFDRLPAESLTAGVWSAPVDDGVIPYVQFSVPDFPEVTQRIWEYPVKDTKGLIAFFEHPAATPAPAGATISLQAALPTPFDPATEGFLFIAIGTWAQRGFGGAELPAAGATSFGPFAFPYDSTVAGGVQAVTGRPLEKITSTDAVLLLRYVAGKLTGVMTATPFEQAEATTINDPMNAVAAGETVEATFNNATAGARFAPARPAMALAELAWNIFASPAYDLGALRGVQLDGRAISAAEPATQTLTFGNPFTARMWKSLLSWRATAQRTVTPTGAVGPITLSAGLQYFAETAPTMTLELPAALPELVTFNTTPLSSDNLSIPQPTAPVTVKISVPPAPATIAYQINVYELVPNAAGTGTDYKLTLAVNGASPDLVVPASFFEVGKTYTLRAHTYAAGFPNAATGDFATRALPYILGFLDSGVFTVTP